MTSSRHVWLAFAICTLVVLATLAWVTSKTFEADRNRWQAEQDALREQNVRLALWRMDTKLTPLIAEETARPHYVYQSFLPTSPQTNSSATQSQTSEPAIAPSPLLMQNTNVLLNFESDAAGNWRSPQTPDLQHQALAVQNGLTTQSLDFNRKRLRRLADEIDPQKLIAQLPEQANSIKLANPPAPPAGGVAPPANLNDPFGDGADPFEETPVTQSPDELPSKSDPTVQVALPRARQTKGGDYQQRGARYQQQAVQEFSKQRSNYVAPQANSETPITSVVESISRPLWMNGELLLARRIQRDGQTFVQGSWLDWIGLKQELLDEINDLFPQADLLPLADVKTGNPSRMLAGLPVELSIPPCKNAYVPVALYRMTTVSSLAVFLALSAVAALLWGTLALSERRAAFVSSVTHELRTPLTTFRMYAEMLAGGMVPQAERRQEYLETLRVESERLSHLVENVLSYARLERGRAPSRDDRTTPAEIVARFEKRLADRAKLAEMLLVVDVEENTAEAPLTTDLGVVEQILFNLVDNAAKYANGADDSHIHLDVTRAATKPGCREPSTVVFSVRDHGPGYASERAAGRTPAFRKSAQTAAETAPGVGLGLALCRRLAKQLGGSLQACNHAEGGAVAALSLPVDS